MKRLYFFLAILFSLLFFSPGFAAELLGNPKFQAFDSNGDPLSGGKLHTYIAGTTTEKSSYSEGTCATPNANPTILDSRGEATVYLCGSYKLVLKDSDDVTIWTMDNIEGAGSAGQAFYYPDYSASDHGVTGDSNTVKYYVDTASTNNATIYFRHNSGSATTTYTFSTTETIPDNIKLIFENGAILADDASNASLTINGPIEVGPNQKVFSWGTGTGAVSLADAVASQSSPRWMGALGDGSNDDGPAFNSLLFDTDHPNVHIPPGTYKISTVISEGGSYPVIEKKNIIGDDNGTDSYLLQDGDKVIDISSADYTQAKNSMLTFQRIHTKGDGSTSEPLWDVGGIDFAIWDNCIFQDAADSALNFYSNLVSGVRFHDNWFWDNEEYCIKIDATRIYDLNIVGNRFEGSGDYNTKNHNGIYLSASPRNHTSGLDLNQMLTALIQGNEFERLSINGIWIDGAVGGTTIKDNQIGYGNIFLGHTTSFAEVSNNIMLDESPSIIDSGYGNVVHKNQTPNMDFSASPTFEDHGYNSMIEKADNYNAQGSEDWTFGAGVSRVKGYGGGTGRYARVNPIEITANGSATITGMTVSASTFYVVRIAWSVSPTTTKRTSGLEVVIVDDQPVTLLDTDALVDDDSSHGHISYDSFVFLTDAGSSTIDISLNGLNNESSLVFLFDIAENLFQDNPNFEDTWVGGLPNGDWSNVNDFTVTEYTTDTHSGTSSLRIQCTNPFSSTNSLYFDYGSVIENGDAYEVSFWIKNLRSTAEPVAIKAGQGYFDDETGPGKTWRWTPMWGHGKWEKVTFQSVHNDSDPDIFYLALVSAGTFQDSIDVLVDDLAAVPISWKPQELVVSTTWNPGSIDDGDEEATGVSVPGAYLGNFVQASFSLDVADLVLDAKVTSDGNVTCVLSNNTGGAVDLASGTLTVKVTD